MAQSTKTKVKKKVKKEVEKQVKQHKKAAIVIAVILIIAVVALLAYGYYKGWFDSLLNPQTPPGNQVVDGELSIHFLELGNNYTGDSVFIKAGNTDILIDAGSRQNSATTIGNYVDQYCEDGVLEYVIVTHAHQDHIAGFVGTASAQGIFDKYECKNIIQFARTDADSTIYNNYCAKRDAEVAAGANLFTALECYNESKTGAQREYDLTGDGSITMEILYQEFYEKKSSDENNYSVCIMIKQGSNNYLFTGDLEEKGEESLVAQNNLPEVVLFKGGHHGSYTASNEVLLSKIKPQYVCVCCCAGSIEYTQNLDRTFPAQDFIDRIAKYTDKVYVTTLGQIEWDEAKEKWKDIGFTSMNGNIVFMCDDGEITLTGSNNNTKLKDTEWFKANRTCPVYWQEGTSTPSMYHD